MSKVKFTEVPAYARAIAAGFEDWQVRRLHVCSHEAGHAIAHWHYDRTVTTINVTGNGIIGGYVAGTFGPDPVEKAVISCAGMAGVVLAGLGELAAFGVFQPGGDVEAFRTLGLGDDFAPYVETALEILKLHETDLQTLTVRLLRDGDMDYVEAEGYSVLDWPDVPTAPHLRAVSA